MNGRLEIYGDVINYETKMPAFGDATPTFVKRHILKKNNYPYYLCRKFVDHFVEEQSYWIMKGIDEQTLLIPVPSTSRQNILPGMFADAIREMRNCKVKHDSGLDIGEDVLVAAKDAYLLHDRNLRFSPYVINDALLAEQCKGFSKIVLVDDMISTGETVINLEKQIRVILAHEFPEQKMPKFAAIAMVPFTKSYPKPLALLNFKNEVISRACLNDKQQEAAVIKAIDIAIGGYLDIRMKREIRGKTFETKEKAQQFCADILKAYANIILLETKIDFNLNREL